MATSREDCDHSEAPLSQPPMDETTVFYMEILTFHLLVNILCRLPVKVLMKLRCVCKSWNSLISDPKFAKDHLRFSRALLNRHHLVLCRNDIDASEFLVCDFRLSSIFNSASTTILERQLTHPLGGIGNIIDSCDGIICFSIGRRFDSVLVWNPSIRKFKILPPLEKERLWYPTYGFGYDRLTDSYKVVAVCHYEIHISSYVCKTQVMVHTLGTDTWRSIQSFPSTLLGLVSGSGKFVSGTINWMVNSPTSSWVIVSLDLGNESSKELLQPDYGDVDVCNLTLDVLRDCLCILAHTNAFFIHVWLLKDYGNKESWTQLFAIPYNGLLGSRPLNLNGRAFTHYILEDDQLLMDLVEVVLVYNPRNGTVKIPEIQYNSRDWNYKHVYIESLISP